MQVTTNARNVLAIATAINWNFNSSYARLLCPLLVLCFAVVTPAQECFFAKQVGSSTETANNSIYEKCTKIKVDSEGNSYMVGVYCAHADLDPGPGVHEGANPGYSKAYYLLKLDPSGNFVWVIDYYYTGGLGFIWDIGLDSNDDIYTLVLGAPGFDIDPGPAVLSHIDKGFIQKLDANGNLIWGKTNCVVTSSSLALDQDNNVIVAGGFSGSNVDFNPGPGTAYLTTDLEQGQSYYQTQAFVYKLSSTGAFVWAKRIPAKVHPGWTASALVDADPQGNVVVVYHFIGTCDFDPGAGSYYLTDNYSNVYACKLDAQGVFLWATLIGLANMENEFNVVMDIDPMGSIILSGYHTSTTDVDNGPGTVNLTVLGPGLSSNLMLLSPDGNYVWAIPILHEVNGYNAFTFTRAIETDEGGNIYLGFSLELQASNVTMDFNPGPGVFNMTYTYDVVLKLTNLGQFITAKAVIPRVGLSNSSIVGHMPTLINDIAVHDESVYVAGSFWAIPLNLDQFDFNPDPNIFVALTKQTGFQDGFISKFSMLTPVVLSETDLSCNGISDGAATIGVINGQEPYTYNWSTDPLNTTASSNSLPTGTTIVTVTDGSGCSVTAPAIEISEPPALQVIPYAQNESCVGGGNNGIASVSVDGGSPPYSYAWAAQPGIDSPDIFDVPEGTYSVTVTDANGCTITAEVIVGYETNPASFTYSTDGMVASFTMGQPLCDTFTWDFGNGNTSTINPNPVVTYATAGTYGACLLCNGLPATCANCINITVPSNTEGGIGISEADAGMAELLVYPNPASDHLIIQDQNSAHRGVRYRLVNALGETVSSGKLMSKAIIPIREQAPGVYSVVLETPPWRAFRIVKQ